MANYVVKYYRVGKDYIVTNLYNKNTMLLPVGDYCLINDKDVPSVNNAIVLNKNTVKINNADKVKKGEVLTFKDFDIIEIDEFERIKKEYIMKLNGHANSQMAFITSLEIFEYLNLFSIFAEKGIFITETNQEESYLEILASGDDQMLENLEKFLDVKEKLLRIQNVRNRLRKAVNQISDAETKEDILKIYDSYKGGYSN